MNAPALVDRLRTRGARLSASGDRLVIDAPPGVVTPADLAELREHKAEVLPFVKSAPDSPDWPALAAERWGPAVGDPTPGLDVRPPRVEAPRNSGGMGAEAPTKPTEPPPPRPVEAVPIPHVTDPDLAAAIDAAWSPHAEAPRRWRCGWPCCYDKRRWWRSIHGAVFCAHCHPPASPGLVAERGDESDAPML